MRILSRNQETPCLTFQLPLLAHSRCAFLPSTAPFQMCLPTQDYLCPNLQNLAIVFHIFMVLRSVVVTGNGGYVLKATGQEVHQCHCCQGRTGVA